jgi:[histone H3]-lysine36 N-trimethyltransferase
MSDGERGAKEEQLESEVQHLKLEENGSDQEAEGSAKPKVKLGEEDQIPTPPPALEKASPRKSKLHSASQSPIKQQSQPHTPRDSGLDVETVGGDITLKMEPGKAPKLERSKSQKVPKREPTLFLDEPDATADACSTFQVIDDCTYANKYIGTTEHALECECDDEWGAQISPSFLNLIV